MGWAKKNEGLRLYYERKAKTYLLVDPESMDGIGEVMIHNDPERPMLATTGVSHAHLYRKCRRASWDDMPPVWKTAMLYWLDKNPKEYRGLWRIAS